MNMLNRASLLSILIALAIASSASASRPLRVAFVADPQVDNPVELDYARRSAYKELREREDLDLVVVLGDLVNDKPGLFAPTIASLDSLGCPWVAVPGNHDRDYGVRPRTLDSFKKYFGSVDTSFVKEGVRFILMNNIRYSGGREETGFSEAQKSWLASVLKTADGSRRTVLATHIPLSSAKAPFSDSLKTILDDCPDLLLVCGHTHNVFRHSLRLSGTREVEELTAGSLCGTWWRGPKDEEGIPYALQNCGAPKGYFVVDFGKKAYSMTYVPLGREKKAY